MARLGSLTLLRWSRRFDGSGYGKGSARRKVEGKKMDDRPIRAIDRL